MGESGVDISKFTSDDVRDFRAGDFDIVISCCGCGAKLDPDDLKAWKQQERFFDWNLDDPPAIDPGDLSEYRRVRDAPRGKCLRGIFFFHGRVAATPRLRRGYSAETKSRRRRGCDVDTS